MPLTDWPWKELLGAGGLGAVAVKAVDWVNSRSRTKAYTMGAVDHAVQTAMGLVTARLEKVEVQHERCEADLSLVRTELDDSKRERGALKAEIDRLMSGPEASCAFKDPNPRPGLRRASPDGHRRPAQEPAM